MSSFDPHTSSLPEDDGRTGSPAADRLHRVLRLSHIFSSVVREILETRLLEEATPLPLTISQFHILKLMSLNGRHQVGELAEFLGVSAPAITKNVDKLERFGLVVRTPSEGDRRAILLAPSQKGRRLVEKYEELKAGRLHPILDEFPAAELDQFTGMLERVAVALLRQERTPRGFCMRCAAYIETGCPVGHVRGGCPYDRVDRAVAGTEVD
ncbi:MAG TPA: MarR family transcriptional regulator [Candidatus Krumholzibacteria bacterium]|nr:MarR family transcriptional regulator [Candidatus Krumholzibacteria bacterium]